MRHKILALILALAPLSVAAQPYTADEETTRLVNLGMNDSLANELAQYISGGNAVLSIMDNAVWLKWQNAAGNGQIDVLEVDASDDTYLSSADVIFFRAVADANRLLKFSAASDTALYFSFGDGGTTAAQELVIAGTTADADDDSTAYLTGAGDVGITRGAYFRANGNEVASVGGSAYMSTGNTAGADINIRTVDDFLVDTTGGSNLLTVTETGATTTAAGITATTGNITATAGSFVAATSGQTLHLQEATAGAKCMGTLTANGATPVVTSTTCAKTASRVFLTRTSAETGVVTAWISAIVDATSFAITGEAGDTGTYNWFIINESA